MKKTFCMICVLALLLTGCSVQSTPSSAASSASAAPTPAQGASAQSVYAYPDYAYNTDASNAQTLLLSTSTTIMRAGTYLISGEITDGTLTIDVDKDEAVHLILNGVSITSSTGPALEALHGTIILTLADGTQNTLTDGAARANEAAGNAALYSKDDLIINGAGSLHVTGRCNDGIATKDDLIITGGDITVTAVGDGLRGRDTLAVDAGTLVVDAGAHALKSSNDIDDEKGNIYLDGGNFTLRAGQDGIHADSSCAITGGSYLIHAGDDGVHADDQLTLYDGQLTVAESYEGLEAANLTIAGGTISVTASDDGLNAAGGTDQLTTGRQQDSFSASTGAIAITGGVITIDAGGDGIDVNGSATMTGGAVYVNGPSDNANGALDYDGIFSVSGGVLMAAGSAGMAQNVTSGGSQACAMLYYNTRQPAGSTIQILDASGVVLAEFSTAKTFDSLVFSAPGMEASTQITVRTNDAETPVLLTADAISVNENGETVQTFGMGGHGGMGAEGARRNPEGTAPGNLPQEGAPQDGSFGAPKDGVSPDGEAARPGRPNAENGQPPV